MIASYFPIFFVDVFGSVLMIILSFMCLNLAAKLRANDRENVIWSYLVWLCYGLVIFAVSRSAGHIVKQLLILNGGSGLWDHIRPFSGAINTFAFILVASISLFFRQTWKIYQHVVKDKLALQNAHEELVSLNQNLEKRVAQRTEALAVESEQRMALEKHMAQAEKLAAIGELSAGVAHEINNPLGIILGYSQLLIRGEDEASEKLEDLKTIEKHVKHCKTIVADLLNFSRSSRPAKEFINVHNIMDEVLGFIKKHTSSGAMRVVKEYDENLPALFIDGEKIKQVFINLFMNARYAMDENGCLTLVTKHIRENDKIMIKVMDTGCGIDEKILNRIFDPFFTTKPTGEGTGLGLAVSYGIIKNHGGDIYVESTPGEGTTFNIILPVSSDATT